MQANLHTTNDSCSTRRLRCATDKRRAIRHTHQQTSTCFNLSTGYLSVTGWDRHDCTESALERATGVSNSAGMRVLAS